MSLPGEFELIERYFAPLASEGSFSLRDDAALLEVPEGKELVVTQDAIAAGVHFFADDPPDTIAKKAIRVNLSDLASKGATPLTFSLALGLHSNLTEEWLVGFVDGIAEDCSKFSLSICGGDTFKVAHGPVVSITAFGLVDKGSYTSRLGASVGDELFVSGQVGLGALGLRVRKGTVNLPDQASADSFLSRYLVPEPPLKLASTISDYASASMDISDGFVGDLEKLAAASGLGFDIPFESIPLPSVLDNMPQDAMEISVALTGGDDYQFIFTVPAERVDDMLASTKALDIQLSHLATANDRPGSVEIKTADGRHIDLSNKSWRHF